MPTRNNEDDEQNATVVFDAAADWTEQLGSRPNGVSADKPDAKSHYIWDLTFDSAGRLYIATGGPGAVYRVDLAKPAQQAGALLQERRAAHPRAWPGTRRAI